MALPDWAPTPQEVKSLMPTRVGGRPFGEDTTPSLAQVTEIIEAEAEDLTAYVGWKEEVPEQWAALAKKTVAYGVAAEIETTFYPEQSPGENTTAERYRERFEARRDRLTALVGDTAPDHDARSPKGKFATPRGESDSEYRPISSIGF